MGLGSMENFTKPAINVEGFPRHYIDPKSLILIIEGLERKSKITSAFTQKLITEADHPIRSRSTAQHSLCNVQIYKGTVTCLQKIRNSETELDLFISNRGKRK